MHPATAQTFGVSRVEQVTHHQCSVFLPGIDRAIGQDHQHNGSAEERVEVIPADDNGIESAQLITHLTIGDGEDDGTLTVFAGRRIHARLTNRFYHLFGWHLIGIAAYAAACHQVVKGSIHSNKL